MGAALVAEGFAQAAIFRFEAAERLVGRAHFLVGNEEPLVFLLELLDGFQPLAKAPVFPSPRSDPVFKNGEMSLRWKPACTRLTIVRIEDRKRAW